MEDNIDIRAFFKENADTTGERAVSWGRLFDLLSSNGIKTMNEFVQKDIAWLTAAISAAKRDGKPFDITDLDLATEIQMKCGIMEHRNKLRSLGELLVENYIEVNAPPDARPVAVTRLIKTLQRGGIFTMKDFCAKTDAELMRIRNMGEKGLKLATQLRDKYIAETGGAEKAQNQKVSQSPAKRIERADREG